MGTQVLVFRLASGSLGDHTNCEHVTSGSFRADIVVMRTVQVLGDPRQSHPVPQI